MIKCAVIDDEPLARECIINYINEIDFLKLVGKGSNPLELKNILNANSVDLIFLDIQMPVMNGIDFLKMTPNLPMVIITTAFPSYALEGYDLDIIDYLLKPITFNRFFKAIVKANDFHYLQENGIPKVNDHFFIKCDNKYEKILFDEVLFIQSLQNYVTIHTAVKKYTTLLPLKTVEKNLNTEAFIKTHKSYIVSLTKIKNFESHELTINTFKIPISRNYRTTVKEKILGNKLWKKQP